MTVTAVAGVLAAVAGRPVGAVALVTVAVFCGQLSVGWSNDAIDAERDAHTDRRDKPTVANGLSPRALFTAALVAVAVSAVLSLAVGPAGWWHIAALVSAWAYNWPLKRTIASALPFAISFGALVAFAAPDSGPGLIAAGAALGVAAHFANVIPDLADDAATGVVGLPHRLGERGSLTVCALAALAAITLLSVRLPLWWPPVVVVTVALACCLARPRWAFRIIQAVALGAVALLLVSA